MYEIDVDFKLAPCRIGDNGLCRALWRVDGQWDEEVDEQERFITSRR